MADPRPILSVAIITLNEQQCIARCLQCIRFSEVFGKVEIVVVDAESRDRTATIAGEYGARVFVRPWPGYGEQRNWALQQCTGQWIMMLDADEQLTPELVAEIERKLPAFSPDVDGCRIRWHDFYLGKWMKHGGWSPLQLRLVRNGAVHCTITPVHEGLRVKGKCVQLDEAVNHYSYESIRDVLDKADRYSSLTVLALDDHRRRSWKLQMLTAPLIEFVRMYIRGRGFLDGWHGFVAAAMSGFHQFLVYAKVWERDVLNL